jgi:hypothetical protein
MKILPIGNSVKTNPNKANQTQYKPNSLDAQTNVSSVLTKDYENKPLCRCGENKPKQTQLQTQMALANLWDEGIIGNMKIKAYLLGIFLRRK